MANQYNQKEQMKAVAEQLRAKGIEVTSTWMEEPHAPGVQLRDVKVSELVEYAYRDLLEITQADLMVFFAVDPTTPTFRGGRHVEFGYALANRKPIVVVGPKENIFHYTSNVRNFDNWDDALYYLERRKRTRQ